jgi:hypothetical protein
MQFAMPVHSTGMAFLFALLARTLDNNVEFCHHIGHLPG